MNRPDCETIQDLLPELDSGSMAPEDLRMVEAHLGSCSGCERELEMIRALRRGRPGVPPELEARLQARVREEMLREGVGITGDPPLQAVPLARAGRGRLVPSWALSAAAVVVLALGTGIIWTQRTSDLGLDTTEVAAQDPLPEAWLWDDGMVAGAPVFDGLSDEDLEALLKEFEG